MMTFAERPASQTWETIPIGDRADHLAWAWFKPANVPNGMILRVPDALYQTDPHFAAQITLRWLLHSSGVDPASLAMWQVYGVTYDGMQGMNPLLDLPVPPPVPGMDPSIVVYIAAQQFVPVATVEPATSTTEKWSIEEMFDHMDNDWRAAMDTDKDMVRKRKKLADMHKTLKNLNRDLNPQERLHGTNEDKREWIDARRWLRDCMVRIEVCIRDFDIGDTSAAGRKRMLEHLNKQYVQPRKQFEGMEQAQRDFEAYRKAVTTLQMHMNNAYQVAAINGERRAQAILGRIAAKVREATTRRNALGVMFD